jgi:hypothetical protein
MSFADATFMIGYSRPEYEPMFVKRIFETIFGLGFVDHVREFVVTPLGRPAYKKFYIYTIDDDHPASIRLTKLIDDYNFAAIAYKNEWDHKTHKVVDRYWKVYHTDVCFFTPYLMNETQLAKTIDPWSTEADPAFASARCALTQLAESRFAETQTLELPPPMVRDETEHWTLGQPCKLERSSNDTPAAEDIAEYDEAADVSNDFDELAAAIAEFGEDYPGSIARPSAMVRCDSEPYPEFGVPTEMVRDDSDRFNEPYRLRFEETEESGTTKICRGEDPAEYGIGPPPKLVRTSTTAEWFSAVSGNY